MEDAKEWIIEFWSDAKKEWLISNACKRESGNPRVENIEWCIEKIRWAINKDPSITEKYRLRHHKNKKETISAVILIND